MSSHHFRSYRLGYGYKRITNNAPMRAPAKPDPPLTAEAPLTPTQIALNAAADRLATLNPKRIA